MSDTYALLKKLSMTELSEHHFCRCVLQLVYVRLRIYKLNVAMVIMRNVYSFGSDV